MYAIRSYYESLYLGEMPVAEQAQLDALLECTRWVREITNGTPEDIYPQSLTEQAAEFIRRQSYNFV